jgi:hypothetical protein
MKEPSEGEVRHATTHAAMYFVISVLLACFAVYILVTVSIWLRVLFVLSPLFFGWLSFFAPPRILVFVMKWLP